jgi:hypothetical protein
MDLNQIIASVQKSETRYGYDSLAPHERIVFDVSALEAEVNNLGVNYGYEATAAASAATTSASNATGQ